jgi:imipenem/basic amino acid-specific outer membrane pore
LVGGKFTAFKNQDSSSSKGDFAGYGVNTDVGSISFVGADFTSNKNLGARLYASQQNARCDASGVLRLKQV